MAVARSANLRSDAVDHGENELFDLVRLNFGLGEELGGAEAEL